LEQKRLKEFSVRNQSNDKAGNIGRSEVFELGLKFNKKEGSARS